MADRARDVVGGIGRAIGGLFAEGGVVTRPTVGLIGEAGEPEAVIPLSRAKEFGFGGGREINITVNISGPTIFDDITYGQFVRQLSRDLQKEAMRFA